ncbi:MAG: hypothetical protein JWM19_1280 [Actinomycetia bacterium]|nr:hypothetical protein [Actinomycetes bacterium]
MPAGAILVIIIVCVLIAVAAGIAAARELRPTATRRQFGPEYDRLASKVGDRRARAKLAERSHRVAGLGIQPLDPEVRHELESSWAATQEAFVEDPPGAVKAASNLVLRAAQRRGYPAEDREQLLADLSVHHARQLDNYRRAEQTAAALGSASAPTEQLRQALLGYRAMFQELAKSSEPASSTKQGVRSRTPKLRQALPSSQREGANQA